MKNTLVWRAVSQRRQLLLVFIACGLALLPVILTVIRPSYNANSRMLLISEDLKRDPFVKGRDIPALALSNTVLTRVKQSVRVPDTVSRMRGKVTIKAGEESNMLTVSYRDHDAALATKVVNAMADQTALFYQQLSSLQYDRLLGSLRGQMDTQKHNIASLDHQVQRAASADHFVSSDKAIDTITMSLNDLQVKRGDAMAALTADQAAAAAAASQPAEVAGIMRDQQLQSDPYYRNLRDAQARDAAALAAVKAQYTALYPGLPSLNDQVRHESQVLSKAKTAALANGYTSSLTYAETILDRRKAEALVAGDKARVQQYDAQIGEQQKRLADLSTTGVSVAVLRAERDSSLATYQQLASALAGVMANRAEATSLGSLIVVDRATEAKALLESFFARVVVGVVAVLALAFALVVVVEFADPRLRTPSDIERLYGRPVIATVGS